MANTVSDWFRDFDAYGDIIDPLIDGGWLEFVFPFLLVYAVVYTISSYIKVFEKNKAVRVILSLVVGLFAIAFPINDAGYTLGEMMSVLFPGVTAISVLILSVYILLALFGFDLADFFKNNTKYVWVKYILGALALLLVLYYFAKGFGWDGFGSGGSDIEDFLTDPGLYILILIIGLLWFLSRDEDPAKLRTDAENRLQAERLRRELRDLENGGNNGGES